MFDDDTHKFIDSHHHIAHLCLRDHSISVQIINPECPRDFLLQRAVEESR